MARRARSPRASHRRHVLDVMAALKRLTAIVQADWTARGTVYESHPDGPSKMGTWRPRTAAEYPENNPDEWARLVTHLDDMINGLTILRGQAIEQRAEAARTGQP